MPFDSSGVFNRVIPGGWKADRDAGTKITAVRHDDEDDGFATGLSTCITRTGVSTILADIPWNNKKIVALGEPTNATDAATKNYVDNFKTFTTGAEISGAGPINGFLTFSSPTGVNGIGWMTADMSWIGRVAVTNESARRLAVNDKPDGTGADVFSIDETGRANSVGVFSNNLDYENSTWRTIVAGIGTVFSHAGGALSAMVNDVATTVAHQAATMRTFFKVDGNSGSTIITLDKSASGKYCNIYATMATKLRWRMDMGGADAETATERVGSNFAIYSYNNAGSTAFTELNINRATHKATFGGEVYAALVTSSSNFDSVSTTCILSATSGGAIYFRPNGPTSTVEQAYVDTAGGFNLTGTGGVTAAAGLKGRAGQTGSYSPSYNNFYWDGTYMRSYVSTSLLGYIAWQCDYRFKKNIQPLPSMWDKVKSLRPISFQQKAWDIFVENDDVRWGFVAHELQEKLIESAATGHKDEENVVQSPNLLALIAALTKALQEAQTRIEALEARP
jgi:hypothetical protein